MHITTKLFPASHDTTSGRWTVDSSLGSTAPVCYTKKKSCCLFVLLLLRHTYEAATPVTSVTLVGHGAMSGPCLCK